MTMIEVPAVKGRRVKFTPERIEQIRNLVDRGMSREDIAATIDVTVGSLQVTCSRLGISLRRPRLTGDMIMPNRKTLPLRVIGPASEPPPEPENGNGNNDVPHETPRARAQLSLVVSYRGRERRVDLDLAPDIIDQLAIEAAFKGVSIAQVVASRIIAGKRDNNS